MRYLCGCHRDDGGEPVYVCDVARGMVEALRQTTDSGERATLLDGLAEHFAPALDRKRNWKQLTITESTR